MQDIPTTLHLQEKIKYFITIQLLHDLMYNLKKQKSNEYF